MKIAPRSILMICLALVGWLWVFGMFPLEAEACPNCKNSVALNGGSMAAGFAWSIALMILMPLSIVTGWLLALRRLIKRSGGLRLPT